MRNEEARLCCGLRLRSPAKYILSPLSPAFLKLSARSVKLCTAVDTCSPGLISQPASCELVVMSSQLPSLVFFFKINE